MSQLAPLSVFVPIAAACLIAPIAQPFPRVARTLAIGAALATAGLSAATLAHVWAAQRQVYWMAGWHPRPNGIVLGIDLVADPLGAGAATFAALLVAAALIYAQRYLAPDRPALFEVLMLVFCGGMVGFALSGDLFNMFVFFELMSAPAYALTGYMSDERGPLQGALNFGITNSVGAFMTLAGIGLLYGRTGALNLAQIGASLAHQGNDPLVAVAFVLVLCGFLVKSAVVPFHFWLADAHATAPVPVCVLFSGIMVQLGLLGIARIYWTVFAGVPPFHSPAVVHTLLVVGVVTTVVGALMTFLQRHLKRLLAFSTISHTGMFLIGLALLRAHGASAVALFAVAHGLVKGAMFMLVGIVGKRLGSTDEVELHGRGRELKATGALFALGGLALATLPPFGPFLGKALLDEAAAEQGFWWVAPLLMAASALAGGAVLRAAAGVFFGLGRPAPPALHQEGETGREAGVAEPDDEDLMGRTPATMFAPAALLLAAGLALPLVPRLVHGFERAAVLLTDRAAYAADVLHHRTIALAPIRVPSGPQLSAYLWAAGSVLGALLCAAAALYLPALRREGAPQRALEALAGPLRTWHSGHVGDYVTWLAAGVAVLGWTFVAVLG